MSEQKLNENRRLRILLVAEAANPALTSVALIGWAQATALGQLVDAHVVTEVRNADEIAKHGWSRSFYTVIDNQKYQGLAFDWARRLRGGENLGWTMYSALANFAYPRFEQKLWHLFKDRLAAGEFDLVHRLTPLSPTSPSPLAGHCKRLGIPYIAGPLNGGLPWPPGYNHIRRKEREWLSYVRGLYKWQPSVRSVYRNASAIIAASQATADDLPGSRPEKMVYLPENGIDAQRFPREAFKPATPRLRIAFTGRLVPYKGADIVLRAAAELVRSQQAHIDIIGDGPQRPELEAIIKQEKIGHGVTLHGWVAHEQVNDLLAENQIFAFPSIREFGGGVVLEAMAKGLMPIIVDYGGPAELLPDDAGIKIPLAPPENLTQDMKNWLTDFQANLHRLDTVRAKAQEHVYRHFTWEAKAAHLVEIYNWVLGHQEQKPVFGTPLAVEERSNT